MSRLPGVLRWALCATVLGAGVLVAVRKPPARAVETEAEPEVVRRDTVGMAAGYRLPQFSAVDLAGERHDLNRYKGQILVLHFWGSWCPYCRGEIPKLIQITEELSSKGVRVLSIGNDSDAETLKAFVTEQQLPYPVIVEAEAEPSVFDRFGIEGVPVTFIVGRDGYTAFRLNGSADIVGSVQSLLD